MLYLNDEDDGELVLPSFDDSKPLWTDGFRTMMKNIDVKFIDDTIEIKPKRNRCVFVRVGLAHYVKLVAEIDTPLLAGILQAMNITKSFITNDSI